MISLAMTVEKSSKYAAIEDVEFFDGIRWLVKAVNPKKDHKSLTYVRVTGDGRMTACDGKRLHEFTPRNAGFNNIWVGYWKPVLRLASRVVLIKHDHPEELKYPDVDVLWKETQNKQGRVFTIDFNPLRSYAHIVRNTEHEIFRYDYFAELVGENQPGEVTYFEEQGAPLVYKSGTTRRGMLMGYKM